MDYRSQPIEKGESMLTISKQQTDSFTQDGLRRVCKKHAMLPGVPPHSRGKRGNEAVCEWPLPRKPEVPDTLLSPALPDHSPKAFDHSEQNSIASALADSCQE